MARTIPCAPSHHRRYTIMAASEHTPHYSLSQFGPGDRPSWIDDYNEDMRAIDGEISDIKNRLDASNTVYNYFTWSGNAHQYVTPGDEELFNIGDESQEGLGDNAIINLLSESTVRINQDGIYAIWSTVNVGRFSGGLDKPVALSLILYTNDESGYEWRQIPGNFVKPLTTESAHPASQLEQSLSLPPTVVSLRSGVNIMTTVVVYSDPNNPPESGHAPIEVFQLGAAMGIVKIR